MDWNFIVDYIYSHTKLQDKYYDDHDDQPFGPFALSKRCKQIETDKSLEYEKRITNIEYEIAKTGKLEKILCNGIKKFLHSKRHDSEHNSLMYKVIESNIDSFLKKFLPTEKLNQGERKQDFKLINERIETINKLCLQIVCGLSAIYSEHMRIQRTNLNDKIENIRKRTDEINDKINSLMKRTDEIADEIEKGMKNIPSSGSVDYKSLTIYDALRKIHIKSNENLNEIISLIWKNPEPEQEQENDKTNQMLENILEQNKTILKNASRISGHVNNNSQKIRIKRKIITKDKKETRLRNLANSLVDKVEKPAKSPTKATASATPKKTQRKSSPSPKKPTAKR
jgi:hypothetical protein